MTDFRRLSMSIFFATAVLLTVGCAGSIPPAGTAAYQPTEYRMAAGDRLRITVFGEEALTREYAVSSAGDLAFPLVGDIPVVGKTVNELQATLIAGLSKGYINDPRVTAEILNYRPFYVLGEVAKSGEFPFSDDLTVQQAVALAGGYTYRADQRRVFIRRRGQAREETYELTAERPVFVSPGDTIRVGERYF